MTNEVKIVYENTNYKVEVDDDVGNGSYNVVNKEHEVTEATFKELPSALSFSEQMDRILKHNLWEKYAKEMTPTDEDLGNIRSSNVSSFPKH